MENWLKKVGIEPGRPIRKEATEIIHGKNYWDMDLVGGNRYNGETVKF